MLPRRVRGTHRGTYLSDVIQRIDLRGQPPMDAQELLVHQGSQGQAVKGVHARVVHALRVFDLTCGHTAATDLSCVSGIDIHKIFSQQSPVISI